MPIQFHLEEEWMEFRDPTKNWESFSRKTEVRYDPLTGDSARILYYPMGKLNPPDYREAARKTKEMGCPFCPENIWEATPQFPPLLSEEGRFQEGEAIVFPNMFPYSKHSAVGIFSGEHYLPLNQFTIESLSNGFIAAQRYLETVCRNDPLAVFTSINWNYMPFSGGSIIHPHLQIIGSLNPTNYQRRTLEAGQRFYETEKDNYYLALAREEKSRSKRFIAENEQLTWLHAFAPQGQMDIFGIFHEVESLPGLSSKAFQVMSEGLLSIFRYLQAQNFVSFNFALFVPVRPVPGYQPHVRLIPRTTLGPLGTSDANYFKILHNESLSLKNPEEAARELREYF